MLEMLVNPRKAERHPWELFFVGLVYASLALLLVHWIFSKDPVLSQYSGVLIVTFTVMFSMPFVYYTLKLEERKVSEHRGTIGLLKEHERAIYSFLWLFMGFVVAFSFWYVLFSAGQSFNAQIETFCQINKPGQFSDCITQYGIEGSSKTTGFVSSKERLIVIFSNNAYVLLFTLIFSLIFGAGAIFLLAWNASVIAAAIGIFASSKLSSIPTGLARYMIHGIPEIAAYFVVALAGGIISMAVIKKEVGKDKFWEVLQDSLNLILIGVVILFIAALIEVFVTPILF